MVALGARIASRAVAQHPARGHGAHPADRARDPRGQPHLQPRRRRSPARSSPTPSSGAGSTGWASARSSTGRCSAGSPPTAGSTRWTAAPRTSRPSGWRPGSSRPGTSCSCSRRARAARRASSRRPRTASRCSPSAPAPRSSRSASTTRTRCGRRAASSRRRSRAARSRCGSASRSVSADVIPPTSTAEPRRPSRRARSWAASPSSSTPATGASTRTPSARSRRVLSVDPRLAGATRIGDVCEHRCRMGTVETVRIAKRTGFCYGVREAIDKAKESAAGGKATHTLGQVVHNEGVIQNLLDFGVRSVESLDDVDNGAAVVIRAHGVKPEVFERAEAARPRGHRRHLHLGDRRAAPAPRARRGGLHDRPPRHPEAPRGRRPARVRAGRDRRRRGGGLGQHPAPQADGPDHPVDPAALEVREARRVHGQPRARAQDPQHRVPGHDPAAGGHARARARGRGDGRRRRAAQRQHQGAHPAVRDRRDARDPDRERARPRRPVRRSTAGASSA